MESMMMGINFGNNFDNNKKCCNKVKIAYMNYVNVYYLPLLYEVERIRQDINNKNKSIADIDNELRNMTRIPERGLDEEETKDP